MEEVVSEAGAASCWRSGSVARSRPPQLLLNWRRRSVSVGGPPPLTPHSPAQILPRPVASQGRDCGPLGLQSPVIVMTGEWGPPDARGCCCGQCPPTWYRSQTRYDTVQFSSVAQSCPTLCDLLNHSMPGLPVHHQLLEFTQTHVH